LFLEIVNSLTRKKESQQSYQDLCGEPAGVL
jgi:hypothetical protein